MLVTTLPSHARDGAAEASRPQCDVDAESCSDNVVESCWRQRYRGDLTVM
jgi:hypothetical protein